MYYQSMVIKVSMKKSLKISKGYQFVLFVEGQDIAKLIRTNNGR